MACVEPIVNGVKNGKGNDDDNNNNNTHNIVLHDVTEHGIFQTLMSQDSSNITSILAIDECFGFIKNVPSSKKNSVDIEKLCKLYDGSFWMITKGSRVSEIGQGHVVCDNVHHSRSLYEGNMAQDGIKRGWIGGAFSGGQWHQTRQNH